MANKNKFEFFSAISLGLQLGFSVVIPLVGFLLAGIFLDKKLNSSPLFLILLLIFYFLFLFFEIRYFLAPFLKK